MPYNDLSQNAFSRFNNEKEFLPVDEAYKLSVRQTESHLIAEWVIAEQYFLYGEQFHFSIDGKTVTATRPKGKITYDAVFEKDVEKYYVYVQAQIDKSQLPASPSTNSTFTLSITYQGCADAGLCYPPETKQYRINLEQNVFIPATSPPKKTYPTPPSSTNTSLSLLFIMLGSAFVGGLILNLMPCVFPILSIKALSIANNHHYSLRIRHGWSYTIGCLLTFVIIAGLLLIVRDAGKAVGWGFQLQSPAIVTLLAFLFFIMGLSLSGLITLSTRWMNSGQSLTEGNGISQSFFTGMLSTIVASPCTAPFMASALGYALVQPTAIALSIFATLGFGMAFPFLLLSYLPQLEKYLPKPGVWMDTFKQALAFPPYLTSIWLLWVLGHQVGHDGVILVIIGATSILFAVWLNHKKPSWSLPILAITTILILSITWNNQQQFSLKNPSNHSAWRPYTQSKLNALRQQGKPVFVNLTADWCLTCKVNEELVFTQNTLEWMQSQGIHLLEGDWTNYNAEITELLDHYGRGGVPLYLLFPANPNGPAKVLPQILNPITFKELVNDI
ncbi:hypothetical protein AB835_01715 [Candidatus Endobugula sertula]|uniref:Cytochrome C biogenesis protein n=1 Tax=Candidatus Endobugula sertula TaxID=62101 RepID=A0A1D2QT93_9GAMM|nr:hypothetical protein AB835_01715 [Candidatus Endobugula sertula]